MYIINLSGHIIYIGKYILKNYYVLNEFNYIVLINFIQIPSATTVAQLLLPHFGLGLGIGIIDAALVPLLATFVDATLAQANMGSKPTISSHTLSSYGTVYAIQQMSVSLAYCLAPLIGGELAQAIGFAWLMRIVGMFNIIYGPMLVYLYYKYDPKVSVIHNLRNSQFTSQLQLFMKRNYLYTYFSSLLVRFYVKNKMKCY